MVLLTLYLKLEPERPDNEIFNRDALGANRIFPSRTGLLWFLARPRYVESKADLVFENQFLMEPGSSWYRLGFDAFSAYFTRWIESWWGFGVS